MTHQSLALAIVREVAAPSLTAPADGDFYKGPRRRIVCCRQQQMETGFNPNSLHNAFSSNCGGQVAAVAQAYKLFS